MKRFLTLLVALVVLSTFTLPASAYEYSIAAPDAIAHGKPTSIEVVHTPDGGAVPNQNVSKTAALIPPDFGSETANSPGTGHPLTPNLAPEAAATGGSFVSGNTTDVVIFPATTEVPFTTKDTVTVHPPKKPENPKTGTHFTEVSDDLYYSAGHIATLKIPAIDLSVRVYEGTDPEALSKGVGHFSETSIWEGSIGIAGHNRGVNSHFGQLHTLEIGDTVTLTTRLGSRTYEVFSVAKVSETDRTALTPSAENLLTLYTCVKNQSAYRWCVQAAEIG